MSPAAFLSPGTVDVARWWKEPPGSSPGRIRFERGPPVQASAAACSRSGPSASPVARPGVASRKRRRDPSSHGSHVGSGSEHEGSPCKRHKIQLLTDAVSSVFRAVSRALSWAVRMSSSPFRGGARVARDILSDSPAQPPSRRALTSSDATVTSDSRRPPQTAATRRPPLRGDRDLLQSPSQVSHRGHGGVAPRTAPPPPNRRMGSEGPPALHPPLCPVRSYLERLHLSTDARKPPDLARTGENDEQEKEDDNGSDREVSCIGIVQTSQSSGISRERCGARWRGDPDSQPGERPPAGSEGGEERPVKGEEGEERPVRGEEERRACVDGTPRGSELFANGAALPGQSDKFPALTKEMMSSVDAAWGDADPDAVVSRHGHFCITRQDLSTLKGSTWLNDKVIDVYLSLVSESGHDGAANAEAPDGGSAGGAGGAVPIYAFTTFFYTRLREGGFTAVRRWTKRVDVFASRILLVPVHWVSHWCLIVVDVRKQRITYYDPLGCSDAEACRLLLRYLCEESEEKRGRALAPHDWTTRGGPAAATVPAPPASPRQGGPDDCGVFVCQYARYAAQGLAPDFGQQHMAYFRRRMAWEILHTRLL